MLIRLVSFSLLLTALLAASDSPAQQRIADAQRALQTGPKSSQVSNDLASAYLRRARETGDPSYLDKASEAVRRSMELAPADYEAKKLRVAILLAKQDFPEALKQAEAVHKQVPDDLGGWGLLADANTALGNYEEAEKDVQWMLDLRPGNVPAFVKAAGLRDVFGDPEGALEFYDEALRRTPDTETEERAWLLTQKGRMQLLNGNPKRAGELYEDALKIFPEYHLALASLAALKAKDKNYTEAASLLDRVPFKTAANLYAWAEALENSGRTVEAQAAFKQFEAKARTEPELVAYYAGHRNDPAKALAIAERAYAVRHDIPTLDAYALALNRNGKTAEAKTQICRVAAIQGKTCPAQ